MYDNNSTMAGAKEGTPEIDAAVKKFQELRSKEQMMVTKVTELTSQEAEYRCERLRFPNRASCHTTP
jgi:hypothetical protein